MRQLLLNSYTLLSDSHKKKIIPQILLLTLGSLLDFFSLASFLPVIWLIINPQQTLTYSWLRNIYNIIGFDDPVYIAVLFTAVALFFIVLKTQIQIWISFRKASYAYNVGADLASRAMTHYLNISHIQFTQSDYSREVNRISNLPLIFANNIVIPFGTILSETVVSFLLFGCLALYDYKIFIFLAILLIPVLFLYHSKRKKISQISEQLKITIPLLLKHALQAVESLLEIRLHQKETYFKNRFNQTFHQLEKTFALDHANNTSAARTTELIATLCVGTLLLYVLLTGQSTPNSILLLTVYAGASFRIIPSVNRVFAALLQIRTNEYVLQELQHSVADKDNYREAIEPLQFKSSIELRNIYFAYESKPLILKDASLTISKHEKILLTGKSGSGKTSLLLILLRYVTELQGGIYIDEKKLETEITLKWQRLLGYVPQTPVILDSSIFENIAFGVPPDQINHQHVSKLIHDLDLQEWIDSLAEGLHTIIGERGVKISGGQRQRLAIARTLYHGAEILLLDEITNQLDKQTRQEILKMLSNGVFQNKTIIMVSHLIEDDNFFDSIYAIQNEQIIKM